MKAALAVLLAMSTGCSWMAVRPPPRRPDPRYPVECTSSPTAPVLDAAVALALIGAVAVHDKKECPQDDEICFELDFTPLLLVPAVLYGLSSITGFSRTAECRDAIARHPTPMPAPIHAAR